MAKEKEQQQPTPTPQQQKDIYTPEELAAYLSLSWRYITDCLRTNDLKGHKKGKKWFILHTDVMEWIVKDKNSIFN